MQIEIKVDPSCKETKIIVVTDQVTDEINRIVKKLSDEESEMIAGTRNDAIELLEPRQIVRIYASQGKVYAKTNAGEYALRLRLYELEEKLDGKNFVRISNSELINLKKAKKFDLSFSGTICVSLEGGDVTYVSRRYVSKIKKILGI